MQYSTFRNIDSVRLLTSVDPAPSPAACPAPRPAPRSALSPAPCFFFYSLRLTILKMQLKDYLKLKFQLYSLHCNLYVSLLAIIFFVLLAIIVFVLVVVVFVLITSTITGSGKGIYVNQSFPP